MALISEVAEKIYEIQPEGNELDRFPLCTVYLVVDEKSALVETGCSAQASDILKAVERLGYDIRNLSYIIPTHVHLDHGGAAGHLAQQLPQAQGPGKFKKSHGVISGDGNGLLGGQDKRGSGKISNLTKHLRFTTENLRRLDMSAEENKAIVRRFVEEVQNQHDIEALDKIFSPDFADHSGISNLPPTLDGARQFFTMLFTAFPDIHVTIHDQVAEGDKVVTRKSFHGTHQGEFMGIPPTDKPIALDVIDIFRVSEGKITDHWAVADMLGLMQQLGVVSPPGQSEG